jgi:GNAT superfamily N-acetyltransferase
MDQKSTLCTVRIATESDAAEIARHLTILGHPTTTENILIRWGDWTADGNTCFIAQRADGAPCGIVTLHKMVTLHRPWPIGRITALVVDDMLRGTGVGRALVEAAEEFLARDGCGMLEITSHARLVEAHAFYEHLGYERTSVRLAKSLVK